MKSDKEESEEEEKLNNAIETSQGDYYHNWSWLYFVFKFLIRWII